MLSQLRVKPGHAAGLRSRDPAGRLGVDRQRVLVELLQGTGAAGKDSTIRHVFTGINPHGCRVEDFAQPSTTDLAHDYLWRVHGRCPARGQIGIWNRSHYQDVIAVRVRSLAPEEVWRRGFRHICSGSARSRRPTRRR